jgi:hypothetical protein
MSLALEHPLLHTPLSTRTVLLVSFLILIPCFWHAHIQAGDLGSHVYNAWLAMLIERGQAPGLYLAVQWKNVLFDLLLFYFCKFFGFALGEKFAVSICVLIFFWGVFAFLRAATGRSPWFLTPVIAMLSYGYVFHMGFMNYYLSIGLALLALAWVCEGSVSGLIAGVLFLPLLYLAHPLGFLFFLSVAIYWFVRARMPGWWKLVLPFLVIAGFTLLHIYFARNEKVLSAAWPVRPILQWNGTDQFSLFGPVYNYLVLVLVGFGLFSAVIAVHAEENSSSVWRSRILFVELYLISFAAMLLLPQDLRPEPQGTWIGEIVTRLTVIPAIFAIGVLATLPPRVWQLVGFALIAVAYFTFVYRDTGVLDRMERNAQVLTRALPYGTRVASTVYSPPGYRPFYEHLVDRACTEVCYHYSNYEPSTHEFRVRVVPDGSPLVAGTVVESEDLQFGNYEIEESDLPMKQIYQCDSTDLTILCIRELQPGENNGRLGYRPAHFPWDP